jgi:adenosyl cobinamide kinase/adenosyl cobinamide phosphate guanylyltransferase
MYLAASNRIKKHKHRRMEHTRIHERPGNILTQLALLAVSQEGLEVSSLHFLTSYNAVLHNPQIPSSFSPEEMSSLPSSILPS